MDLTLQPGCSRDESVALRATEHIQGVPPSCRAEERRRAPADASRTRPSRSPTAAPSQPQHRVGVVSATIATPLEQSPRQLDFVWRSSSSAATPFASMSACQTAPTTRPSSVCSTIRIDGSTWINGRSSRRSRSRGNSLLRVTRRTINDGNPWPRSSRRSKLPFRGIAENCGRRNTDARSATRTGKPGRFGVELPARVRHGESARAGTRSCCRSLLGTTVIAVGSDQSRPSTLTSASSTAQTVERPLHVTG